MKNLAQYKEVLWYSLIFGSTAIIILFEYMFFDERLSALNTAEQALQAEVDVLQVRKTTLNSITPEVISKSKVVTSALPAESSGLLVASALRTAASENGIVLKDLRVSGFIDAIDPTLGNVLVSATAEGSEVSVFAYLREITRLAPVMYIQNLNIAASTVSSVAQFNVVSYWSPLPTVLPSLTQPLSQLSELELHLLDKVGSYRVLQASSSAEANIPVGTSTEPFGAGQ